MTYSYTRINRVASETKLLPYSVVGVVALGREQKYRFTCTATCVTRSPTGSPQLLWSLRLPVDH